MTVLYSGDTALDLYGNTVIGVTIKKLDIGELTSRYVSFTNQIEIPATENNLRALGYPSNEHSESDIPYSINAGKLLQNGLETLPACNFLVRRSTKNKITLQVLENVFDLFENIKGKTIVDIAPFTASGWLVTDVDAARTATSGVVSAIILWGASGAVYQFNFFLPCFYYHSLVTAILEHTGLTLSGDILTDTRFTELAIPFPGDKWEYPPSYGSTVSRTSVNWNYLWPELDVMDIIRDFTIRFGIIYKQVGSVLHLKTLQAICTDRANAVDWSAKRVNTQKEEISFDVTGLSQANTFEYEDEVGDESIGRGQIDIDNDTIAKRQNFFTSIFKNSLDDDPDTAYSISFIAKGTKAEDTTGASVAPTYMGSISAGDMLFIQAINVQGSVGTINTPTGYTAVGQRTFSWGTAALFYKSASGSESGTETVSRTGSSNTYMMAQIYQYRSTGGTLSVESSAANSDTSSFATWNAVTVGGSGRTLVAFIVDYDGIGVDSPTGYTERATDGSTLISGVVMECDDKTNVGSDGAVSNTVASPNGWATWHLSLYPIGGFSTTALIPVYAGDDLTDISTFGDSPGLRLVTLKARTTEDSITFNVSARTDYKIGYFVDDYAAKDTGFQYFIDQFYVALSRALQRNKVITKYFYLTELDIAAYDPHLMIWDGEGYYLINRIVDFVPGKITKVELFKIN